MADTLLWTSLPFSRDDLDLSIWKGAHYRVVLTRGPLTDEDAYEVSFYRLGDAKNAARWMLETLAFALNMPEHAWNFSANSLDELND